jgi:chromosome partitioning protein
MERVSEGQGEVTVIGMLKGGAAKTTSAVYLALVLAAEGKKVVVIDADSVSQTAFGWHRDAIADGKTVFPVDVERYPFPDLGEYVTQLRREYDHVVVDVGGGNAALLQDVLTRANRFIVPLSPSRFDLKGIAGTFKLAKSAVHDHEADGFAVYVLLAKCNDRTTQPRDARKQLLEEDRPVLDAEIPLRVEYERAIDTVPTNLGDYAAVLAEIREAEAA